MTQVLDEIFAFIKEIALMREAVSTSATSVNIYLTTGCSIPENSRVHTRYHENLESHKTKHLNATDLTCSLYMYSSHIQFFNMRS
jgi:hypothetical protein